VSVSFSTAQLHIIYDLRILFVIASDEDKELFITVDNEMELFIDGERHKISDDPSAKDWMQTKKVTLPAKARVIAVKATDRGLQAGLLASVTGDSLLSDKTWKVSTTEVDGWTSPDFDDSQWQPVTEIGPHGMNPWKTRSMISPKATWIWSATTYYADYNAHVVYFRYRISTRLNTLIHQIM